MNEMKWVCGLRQTAHYLFINNMKQNWLQQNNHT